MHIKGIIKIMIQKLEFAEILRNDIFIVVPLEYDNEMELVTLKKTLYNEVKKVIKFQTNIESCQMELNRFYIYNFEG